MNIKFASVAFSAVTVLMLFAAQPARAQQVPTSTGTGQASLSGTGTYDSQTGQIHYQLSFQAPTGTAVSLMVPIPAGTTFVPSSTPGTLNNKAVVWDVRGSTATSVTFSVLVDAAHMLDPWASTIVSVNPGTDRFGNRIAIPAADQKQALGQGDGNSVPLGFGGSMVLAFKMPIINGPGDDVAVYTPDSLGQAIKVEASQNGSDWLTLGTFHQSGSADLGSLPSATFIRLTDVSPISSSNDLGYSIDAVRQLQLVPFSCGIVTNPTLVGQFGTLATASIRTDIVQGCGGGSGMSGVPMSGVSPPATPTSSQTSTGSVPTASNTNGGSGSSTGSPGSNPAGAAAEPTGPYIGSNGLLHLPLSSGGGAGSPSGEVLGAGTTLPRTGIPLEFYAFLSPAILYPLLRKHGSVKNK